MPKSNIATISGRCLCTQVTFDIVPATMEMSACHCAKCRRWCGGVWLAVAAKTLQLKTQQTLGEYASSAWAKRYFCRRCGSCLYLQTNDGRLTFVSAQCLENPQQFNFTSEVFVDSQPTNYRFANKTSRLTATQVLALHNNEN